MMEKMIKKYNVFVGFIVVIGLPLLFWAVGDSPRRSVLKEAISILTLLSFSFMLSQVYLSRLSNTLVKVYKKSKVVKLHKIIGYVFVSVMLLHPFFIVFPRYFESGVEPMDAFITLLTTFDSTGVILGIISWVLMLVLGLSSIFRNRLPMTYKNWRLFHGVLSIVFIAIATWHAIDLGRHTDKNMSILFILLAAGGVLLLLKTYFPKPLFKHNTVTKNVTE